MIFVQFNTVLLEGNVAVVVVAVANMTKVLLGSLVAGGRRNRDINIGRLDQKKKKILSEVASKLSDGKPLNGFLHFIDVLPGS